MKRLSFYTLTVLATLGLLGILWQFRLEILMFLLSLAVAAAFRQPVEYLIARGWRRGFAIAVAYISVAGLAVLLLAAANGPLLEQFERATNNLAHGYERIKATWPTSHSIFQQTIAERLPPPEELYAVMAGQQSTQLWTALAGATTNLVQFVTRLVIILVLSIYWSADNLRFEQLLLSFAPVLQRARIRQAWEAIEYELGGYIRREVAQAVLAGVMLYAGFRLIGLPYPAILALVGAAAWLIPWIGPLITLVPVILAGLTIGLGTTALAIGWVLVTLLFMRRYAAPLFFQGKEYSSVLMILMALILAEAFGLLGLILAPLAAAAIQIAFNELNLLSKSEKRWPNVSQPASPVSGDVHTDRIPAADKVGRDVRRSVSAEYDAAQQMVEAWDLEILDARLGEIHAIANEENAQLTPELANLLQRLDVLAANARLYLENSE